MFAECLIRALSVLYPCLIRACCVLDVCMLSAYCVLDVCLFVVNVCLMCLCIILISLKKLAPPEGHLYMHETSSNVNDTSKAQEVLNKNCHYQEDTVRGQ